MEIQNSIQNELIGIFEFRLWQMKWRRTGWWWRYNLLLFDISWLKIHETETVSMNTTNIYKFRLTKLKNFKELTFVSNEFSFSKNNGIDSFGSGGRFVWFFWSFLFFARAESFFGLMILSSASNSLFSDSDVPCPGATPSANKTPFRFGTVESLQESQFRIKNSISMKNFDFDVWIIFH